jgi:hypothetical protein
MFTLTRTGLFRIRIDVIVSEDSLDRPVRALLPNNEKCGLPCYRVDCAWIKGYPEVIPLNKLSTMWARSPEFCIRRDRRKRSYQPRQNLGRSLLIQRLDGSRPGVEETLWNLNRLWSQKACHTRSLAKKGAIDAHRSIISHNHVRHFTSGNPVFKGEVRTLVSIHAKASAAKRLRSSRLLGDVPSVSSKPVTGQLPDYQQLGS